MWSPPPTSLFADSSDQLKALPLSNWPDNTTASHYACTRTVRRRNLALPIKGTHARASLPPAAPLAQPAAAPLPRTLSPEAAIRIASSSHEQPRAKQDFSRDRAQSDRTAQWRSRGRREVEWTVPLPCDGRTHGHWTVHRLVAASYAPRSCHCWCSNLLGCRHSITMPAVVQRS